MKISVRLTKELAEWLEAAALESGQPQSRIIRDQLEKARTADRQVFLRLAGAISGLADLSSRSGFSRSNTPAKHMVKSAKAARRRIVAKVSGP